MVGHSEETVISDYENLKHCDVIVFDDYFTKDIDGNILGDEYLGTNRLVDSFNDTSKGRTLHCPTFTGQSKRMVVLLTLLFCYRRMVYLQYLNHY
jgi:hypothetical protein